MKDTKLITILRKFSTSDLKRLKDFMYSPYFGASNTERDLFNFIYKYAPNYEHKKFTQKEAAHFIFPNKKRDIATITRLQSRVLKLVESFIYYHFQDKNLPDIELALMRFYRKENLTPQFESIYNRVQKKQKGYFNKNAHYYYQQFQIEKEYRMFLSINFDNHKGDIHNQEVNDVLDSSYLAEKLCELCLMYNRQLATGAKFDTTLMPEILSFLPDSSYKNIPIIRIWHTALLLLKSEEKSEHHQTLTNLLEEHENILNKTDKRVLYTYLENTAHQVFRGDAYYETLFTLYKKQLESGVMYIDGYLLPAIFKNIVTVALRLGYMDWTEVFLEKNKHKIVPEYEGKEDVYSYSVAQLRFKRGEYDEVQTILSQMIFHDIYTKMDVRRMYMKVYYELEYVRLFEDTVNNFRGFLTENSEIIPPVHVQANRDFINTCNGIYRSIKKDHERIDKIEQRISKVQVLPEKTWLLEKLEALK